MTIEPCGLPVSGSHRWSLIQISKLSHIRAAHLTQDLVRELLRFLRSSGKLPAS